VRPLLPVLLVLASVALAACGGSEPPARHAGPSVAPDAAGARGVLIRHVAGTDRSAQDVATAALAAPDRSGPRSEVQPLPRHALRRPIARWRTAAVAYARRMARAVSALRGAIVAGDRAAARRAWRDAYREWVRIGAAYGALGRLGTAIGGTPGRLPRGVRDPRFTGLHRVEHGLWTAAPLPSVAAPAARLARDVARLPRTLRRLPVTAPDYATRAHEILEDALRDQLSGREAPWSGAGLQTTAAAFAATRWVIGTLRPALRGRGDALPVVASQLRAMGGELRAVRTAHAGRLPALRRLSRAERERVQGRLGALLEALAAIPGALETRATPAIPPLETKPR
jgi:iron uptake system component EfeO